MDLKNILEYQKIDGELHALEGKLARSENKKKCIALSNSILESILDIASDIDLESIPLL